MFLKSFRSKTLGRLTSCIKYLALIQSLESSGILALWEGESTFQFGPSSRWRHRQPTQYSEAQLLVPIGLKVEGGDLGGCPEYLIVQNLKELLMCYVDWTNGLSVSTDSRSPTSQLPPRVSVTVTAYCYLESAKCLISTTCFGFSRKTLSLKPLMAYRLLRRIFKVGYFSR